MSVIKNPIELYEKTDINKEEINKIICINMKKFRKEKYEEFKNNNQNSENPYSLDNISFALGISKVHYKRLENKNDKNKNITLIRLIKLAKIYDKTLDDFLQK